MSEFGSDLGQIEKVHVTDKIEEVNAAMQKDWVILKISENTIAFDDGTKTSTVMYHMGKVKKLPI